jgi:hypothetical protein
VRQWRETWGGWEAGPSFQAVLGIRGFFCISDPVPDLVPDPTLGTKKTKD